MRHDQDAGFIEDCDFSEMGLSGMGITIAPVPEAVTRWSELYAYIPYMMKAHSLVSVYKNEFSEDDIESFNQKAIRVFETMSRLYYGDTSNSDALFIDVQEDTPIGGETSISVGRRKLHMSGIPKRKKSTDKGSSPITHRNTKSRTKGTQKSTTGSRGKVAR